MPDTPQGSAAHWEPPCDPRRPIGSEPPCFWPLILLPVLIITAFIMGIPIWGLVVTVRDHVDPWAGAAPASTLLKAEGVGWLGNAFIAFIMVGIIGGFRD